MNIIIHYSSFKSYCQNNAAINSFFRSLKELGQTSQKRSANLVVKQHLVHVYWNVTTLNQNEERIL